MALPASEAAYTFADCLAWDENERIEIIHGKAFLMATPSRIHQEISGALFARLYNFLEGKECRAYPAPFGVRLFEKAGDAPEDVDTLVEPDISVICDPGKLDDAGCKGAPDLILEVLSPSTQRHDRLTKFNLYQQAGVREYWIVDPENKSVQVLLLDDSGTFRPYEDYGREEIARVQVLDGCFIELDKVFS